MRVFLMIMLVLLSACVQPKPKTKTVWTAQEAVKHFHKIAWFDDDWRICEVGINCPQTTDKSPVQGIAITSAIDQTGQPQRPQAVSKPILVHFGFDKTNPDMPPALDGLLKILSDGDHIRITGYTDSTGDQAYNQKLALARAKQVAAWIEQRGVRNPLEIVAKGNCCYLASNNTEQGRAHNRRVEVLIIKRERQ